MSGEVAVPDPRLDKLAAIAKSAEIIPTRITFVDIAGLVRGASKGEGLGNQFLANIREVDAIVHVLRCFEDDDVMHVEGRIDPVGDADTVETELMLSDLESLEAPRIANREESEERREGSQGAIRADVASLAELLAKASPRALQASTPTRSAVIASLRLLTPKPVIYVCNVDEAAAADGNAYSRSVQAQGGKRRRRVVVVSARDRGGGGHARRRRARRNS